MTMTTMIERVSVLRAGSVSDGKRLPSLTLPARQDALRPPKYNAFMVRIKICGVTTPADARPAAEAGADAVGLNFYSQSPRFLSPQQAAAIVRAARVHYGCRRVRRDAAPTGVCDRVSTRTARGADLRRTAAHGRHLPLRARPRVPREGAAGIGSCPPVRGRRSTSSIAKPAAVLIDSHVEGLMGGTGHAAPWELLRGFDLGVPLILAGGLTPENVAEAIALVRPWGIDVASGVESTPGVKDAEKVARFVKNARSS